MKSGTAILILVILALGYFLDVPVLRVVARNIIDIAMAAAQALMGFLETSDLLPRVASGSR